MLKKLLYGEDGQSFMEYGLIAALVVIVSIAAYKALGSGISTKINTVKNELQ